MLSNALDKSMRIKVVIFLYMYWGFRLNDFFCKHFDGEKEYYTSGDIQSTVLKLRFHIF